MPRYKTKAVRIAKELHYPASVINKLIEAEGKEAVNKILITAREMVIKTDEFRKAKEYIFTPHCRGVVRYTA